MEKPECNQKWEAKVCTRLTVATADQIWPLIKDFFNMHKYFPNLTTCYGIHGNNGEPGCIRYCAGSSIPSTAGESTVSWSTERLLAVDHVEKSLTYEILDCNVGFKSYVSTMKIHPGDGDGEKGCVIEWFIAVDPVEGWSFKDLVRKYEVALQCMGKRMEDAIVNPEKANMEEAEPKWEGKATAELRGLKAQEVWPLIEDFCGLGKWLPTIDTCYLLEGTPNQPGLVRYCSSEKLSSGGSEEVNIMWAKEKLIAIDPIGQWLSYEILDNNVGFRSYVATIKVLPMDNDDKCMIEWSFVSDPIEGWGLEHLISYIDNSLQGMAKKMEEALQVKGNA